MEITVKSIRKSLNIELNASASWPEGALLASWVLQTEVLQSHGSRKRHTAGANDGREKTVMLANAVGMDHTLTLS